MALLPASRSTSPIGCSCSIARIGSALAILSKYVLTRRGRHLWNPTNFAISALVLLAPGSVAILSHEMGNSLATNLVIWAMGLLIVSRLRLLHVTLSYAAVFAALAPLRAAITGVPVLAEIAPITGPMYQLFVFFMITDPKTSPRSPRAQVVTAFALVVVDLAFHAVRIPHDAHIACECSRGRQKPDGESREHRGQKWKGDDVREVVHVRARPAGPDAERLLERRRRLGVPGEGEPDEEQAQHCEQDAAGVLEPRRSEAHRRIVAEAHAFARPPEQVATDPAVPVLVDKGLDKAALAGALSAGVAAVYGVLAKAVGDKDRPTVAE